jgi:hypothetical protein
MTELERKTLIEFMGWKKIGPYYWKDRDEQRITRYDPCKVFRGITDRDDTALLIDEVMRRGKEWEAMFVNRLYEEIRELQIYKQTDWNVLQGMLTPPENIIRAVLNTIKDMEASNDT